VTHTHTTDAGDRTYYMHFVKLDNLKPRTQYFYSVQSGGAGADTSKVFNFRSGYADGVTKVDVYGDMGVYEWNCMSNVHQDMAVSREADLVIHMGDHAYNEGEDDERRADGYMSAWQPALANGLWMPIVGNHEYYSGAELGRYLNQTWEGWGNITGGKVEPSEGKRTAATATAGSVKTGGGKAKTEGAPVSTATSALGFMLSTGNHHSAGLHGSTPSGTSRYFSVDFGLIHLVAIDLNVYYGVDPCGEYCANAQKEWLKRDLAAANANRDAVPWVVVMSHYPFYCTGCDNKQVPAKYYESMNAEYYGNDNVTAAKKMMADELSESPELGSSWLKSLRQSSDESIADLMPIIHAGGVDLYLAGHWHYYESLWPATQGAHGHGGTPLQKNFVNPPVTVHVTTGNGGPPSADNFNEDCPGADCGSIPATRKQSVAYGYGRLIAYNSSTIEYRQIANSDSSIVDSWFMTQAKHGPRGAWAPAM